MLGSANKENYSSARDYPVAKNIQKAAKCWFFGKKERGIDILCSLEYRWISDDEYRDLLLLVSSILYSHQLKLSQIDQLWGTCANGVDKWEDMMSLRVIFCLYNLLMNDC